MKNKMKNVLEKVKIFAKNHKKVVIIVPIVIVLIVATILIVPSFSTKNSEENKLSNKLKELGASFYEDYYYDAVLNSNSTDENPDAGKESLANFKDLGLKISLDSLVRVKAAREQIDEEEIFAEFVNSKTNESCDKDSSMVAIYPKEPYGKEDYSINVTLVCGFDETTTTTTTTTEVETSKKGES